MVAKVKRAFDLSVLGEGRLHRLVLAQLSSTVGDLMVLAALPFAVLSIGGSIAQVGIALAAQAVVLAALLLFGGVGGDRHARRSIVIGAVAGPAIAVAVLAVAGPGWAFAVDAVSFLVSAALLAKVKAPPPREALQRASSVGNDLAAGWGSSAARRGSGWSSRS